MGSERACELLAEDLVDLLLELVLQRTEVESLAERVEVAGREERENLQRAESRTGGDECERAVELD